MTEAEAQDTYNRAVDNSAIRPLTDEEKAEAMAAKVVLIRDFGWIL